MVDSNSHTEFDGVAGNKRAFLQVSTWKRQRDDQHEKQIVNEFHPMDLSDQLFNKIHPHIYSRINLYGMNFINWYGSQAQLVENEPELVKEILNNRDGAYQKITPQDYVKKLLGDGLAVSRAEKWYRLRKLASHAFYAESLKGMIPEMIASVEMMLERWRYQNNKEIDVFQEFKILTSEVISRTAFGSSYLEGQNIFNLLNKLGAITARNDYNIRLPGIGKFLKIDDDIESDKIEQGIRDTITEMINKREKKMMNGEIDDFGNDYLGLLLKAYHDTHKNKRVSIDEMVDECKVFYIAGYESSNSSLTWTFFLLALHADWQEKAREELLDIFGQQNPNPEGIARLKTMTMIMNESQRLYVPSVIITRRVERKVRPWKLIIPANTNILISTLALHSDTKIWGVDVHLFNPEIFAEGVLKATNNNATAYLPFGFGPRTCVGMNFTNTEIKIALSMILQCYKFTVSPNYVHCPIQRLIIRP